MSNEIKNLAIIGAGTMGARIAAQAVHYGYRVKAWDPDPKAFDMGLALAKDRIATSKRTPPLSWPQVQAAAAKVSQAATMEEALAGADLVIEAAPENLELKRQVFQQMDQMAPAHAILGTNSSSMPVGLMAGATGRPGMCVNTHFYSSIDTGSNMVDLMGTEETKPEVMETCRQFISSIGCVPLAVKKPLHGFCFNRIWRAIKRESLYMWSGGFVDHRDIDRAWMIWTGMGKGPFALMDTVGLDVVYDIEMSYFNESQDPKDRPPQALKDMVDNKRLGMKTGQGFYSYPDPEYAGKDFLKG